MAKSNDGAAVAVVVLFVVAILCLATFAGAFFSMLVFGAATSEWNRGAGPSYWQTFFGLWSVGIIGGAFNGTRLKSFGNKDK